MERQSMRRESRRKSRKGKSKRRSRRDYTEGSRKGKQGHSTKMSWRTVDIERQRGEERGAEGE